jgi:hypothetical protein
MYRHAPEHIWVDWEKPEEQIDGHDYTGFRAKILRNPTASEVRAENKAFLDWINPKKPMNSADDYYPAIASRVVAWEYEMPDENGDWVAVPAPGEQPDNWQAFLLLPPDLAGWLIRQVRTAHLPKVTTPPSMPVGSTEPPSPSEMSQATALHQS